MREPLVIEYARSFFPVILIVLLFRSFLADEGVLVPDSLRPPRAHRRALTPASGCAAAGRR